MTTISLPTQTLLALSSVKGVGPAALKKIAALPSFWELSIEELCSAVPALAKAFEVQSHRVLWDAAKDWAEAQVVTAEKYNARILTPLDNDYPRLLAATKDDPFILFVRGKFAENPEKSVAIIGTREPTEHGRLIAQRITQFFVEQHWSVVSGLAMGCDAVAHEATIKAGGHTVAVLAHGLQMIAPSRHRKLAEDILDAGGALVSEYAFGRNALGSQFVKRDRTQAGMAHGVVMIQSDVKGGSLHASRAAIEYQRWLAVPYPTDKDRNSGEPKVSANLLIAEGSDTQRAELLRCPVSSLDFVRVVRGRDDYLDLIKQDDDSALESQPGVPVGRDGSLVQGKLLDGSEGMSAPESVPDMNKPKPHVEAIDEPKTGSVLPSQNTIFYYIDVSAEDLVNLRINHTGFDSASQLGVHLRDDDPDIVLAHSRLDYLQAKLDDLWRNLSRKRTHDRKREAASRFQIEDVLTHMKRAVDELVYADRGISLESLRSIMVRHGSTSRQPELPLVAAPEGEFRDSPFVEVLEQLVATLPWGRNICFHGQSNHSPRQEVSSNVGLGELVISMNRLISVILIDRRSSVRNDDREVLHLK